MAIVETPHITALDFTDSSVKRRMDKFAISENLFRHKILDITNACS